MSKKAPSFAAIPERAIGDRRLTGLHMHLLAYVAWHDRFGKNGVGCVVSSRRMAEGMGVHHVTVSAALGDLDGWKYIEAKPFPLDRRRRSYHVRYEAPVVDESLVPEANDQEAEPASFEQVLSTSSAEIVSPEGKQSPEIVSPDLSENAETSTTCEAQYIPRRGLKKPSLQQSQSVVAARATAAVRDAAIAAATTRDHRQRGFAERTPGGELQHVAAMVIENKGDREIPADAAATIEQMRAEVEARRAAEAISARHAA